MNEQPSALAAHIQNWLSAHPLTPLDVDCATTVMLKILDGKCKMPEDEKTVMAELYAQVKHCPGKCLDADIHALIAATPQPLSEADKMVIYEQRLYAETKLSRPVMKAFKAWIREQGLFEACFPDPSGF